MLSSRALVDHTRSTGTELYRLACQFDLEGIVAKRADSPYLDNERTPHWIKIKNPSYSQKEGRGDLVLYLLYHLLTYGFAP